MNFCKGGIKRAKALLARAGERALFLPAAAFFIAVMAACVWYWWSTNPDITAAGRVSAMVSVLLFSVVGVLFLWHWLSDWDRANRTPPSPLTQEKVGVPVILRIFLSLLLLEGGTVLAVFVLRLCMKGETDFRESMQFWTNMDSQHYLDIAEDWYLREGPTDRLVQLVFLPGFPLAIRAVHTLVQEYLYAGMIVSAVSFAGAGTVLYCLARMDMDQDAALRALRYACLLPGTFFYAAPMSESLFLFLSVSCVYLARKRSWLPACILGGMAAFTRSLGLMLFVPVGYELITAAIKRELRGAGVLRRTAQFAALLLIPAGFGAYCLICNDISGDPFQWMVYQREHWHQQLGFFFHTAAYQMENAARRLNEGSDYKMMMGLWVWNLLSAFSALAVMIASIRRIRPSYGAYFIAYYVVAMGTTWLLSGPRYLLVLFPIPLGLAAVTKNRHADAALTCCFTAANILYLLMFVDRWQVW